jgi:hypothetical protein
MGFPTVFIVPNQDDEATLREKLLEWQAILVANSARFEPDRPEMVAIEVAKTIDSQTVNNPKPDQTSETQPTTPTTIVALPLLEPQPMPSTEGLEQQEPIEGESEVLAGADLQSSSSGGEGLLLELVGAGWWFRVRMSRGNPYLCARKGKKERCLGLFTREMQKLVEENNITLKGNYTETP